MTFLTRHRAAYFHSSFIVQRFERHEHYESDLAREQREVVERPEAEVQEVEQVFSEYGLVPEDMIALAPSAAEVAPVPCGHDLRVLGAA